MGQALLASQLLRVLANSVICPILKPGMSNNWHLHGFLTDLSSLELTARARRLSVGKSTYRDRTALLRKVMLFVAQQYCRRQAYPTSNVMSARQCVSICLCSVHPSSSSSSSSSSSLSKSSKSSTSPSINSASSTPSTSVSGLSHSAISA